MKWKLHAYIDKQFMEIRFGFFIAWFDGFQFHIDLGLIQFGIMTLWGAEEIDTNPSK